MASITQADLVRMTAAKLQELMEEGKLSSVDLVKKCLAQINRHDHNELGLRAVISVVPEDLAIRAATKLDEERERGLLRGPLHGIPVLLKDCIKTHSNLGMPTTVGSFALLDAQANDGAVVVDGLLGKGMIVIGKTNLNELVSWKTMESSNGWSAVGGQTISAYVDGGLQPGDGVMGHSNPCGASTGSAVGVSAGFSPIALGTEVDGSLVQPAARAGLYALKPTIRSTELSGVFAVSEDFDALGAMAKSTFDLAVVTELLINSEASAKLPADGYLSFLRRDHQGLTIGVVDPSEWRWPDAVQPQHCNSAQEMRDGYLDVIEQVKKNKGRTVFPMELPPVSEYTLDGQPAIITAIRHVFKTNVDHYLNSLSSAAVRTAEDIVEYNKRYSDKSMPADHPEQGRIIDTLENSISREAYDKAMAHCRKVGRQDSVDKVLEEHNLDLIALPMDSPAPKITAAAGYPIATVPLGTIDYNGQPYGLAIIAKAGRENLLFNFMSSHEANSDPRPLPRSLAKLLTDRI